MQEKGITNIQQAEHGEQVALNLAFTVTLSLY